MFSDYYNGGNTGISPIYNDPRMRMLLQRRMMSQINGGYPPAATPDASGGAPAYAGASTQTMPQYMPPWMLAPAAPPGGPSLAIRQPFGPSMMQQQQGMGSQYQQGWLGPGQGGQGQGGYPYPVQALPIQPNRQPLPRQRLMPVRAL